MVQVHSGCVQLNFCLLNRAFSDCKVVVFSLSLDLTPKIVGVVKLEVQPVGERHLMPYLVAKSFDFFKIIQFRF